MAIKNTATHKAWPKIPRENKETILITEKLNGTNACIVIQSGVIVGIQSRNRMITPGKGNDNAGFASWVYENETELLKLGEGHHFGEWVGAGIQKNLHSLPNKRFYLFNVMRWDTKRSTLPKICNIVPILYEGDYSKQIIEKTYEYLRRFGSQLFDKTDQYNGYTEGIVVFYKQSKRLAKYTYEYTDGKHGDK